MTFLKEDPQKMEQQQQQQQLQQQVQQEQQQQQPQRNTGCEPNENVQKQRILKLQRRLKKKKAHLRLRKKAIQKLRKEPNPKRDVIKKQQAVIRKTKIQILNFRIEILNFKLKDLGSSDCQAKKNFWEKRLVFLEQRRKFLIAKDKLNRQERLQAKKTLKFHKHSFQQLKKQQKQGSGTVSIKTSLSASAPKPRSIPKQRNRGKNRQQLPGFLWKLSQNKKVQKRVVSGLPPEAKSKLLQTLRGFVDELEHSTQSQQHAC